MSTLYVENPHELLKPDLYVWCILLSFGEEPTPGRLACYFSFVAIQLLDLHFLGYMESYCKLTTYVNYRDN